MATKILDLPEEVLVLVAEHLQQEKETLRNLSLVSRRFHAIAEPVLFHDIFFRNDRHCAWLSTVFNAYPRRAAAVQSIDARCRWDTSESENRSKFERLPELLCLTKNITSLTIESANVNHVPSLQDYEFWTSLQKQLINTLWNACQSQDLARQPLYHLKQLTLHWDGYGQRYWLCCGQASAIFALPSLEDLTVSCAILPADAVDSVAHLPQTRLKRLDLIECNITLSGLVRVLSRPLALEHLHIGENNYHDSQYSSVCKSNPSSLFQALQQHENSLKTLSFSPCHTEWTDDDAGIGFDSAALSGGLSPFVKLQGFTIEGRCQGLEDMLTADGSVPPVLESLHIQGDA